MGNFWAIAFGLIFIIIGVGAVFGINLFRYFFPAFLILIGLNLIFNQAKTRTNWQSSMPSETHEKKLNYENVFDGSNKKVITDDFQGGKVTAVFGGMELDLRQAKIAKNSTVHLEVSTVFGGIKVLVPDNWSVQGNLTGVFGGFNNSTKAPAKPEGTLIIKGAAVFGGGEITN